MLKINKDFKPVEEDVQPELVWTKWWSPNIDIGIDIGDALADIGREQFRELMIDYAEENKIDLILKNFNFL